MGIYDREYMRRPKPEKKKSIQPIIDKARRNFNVWWFGIKHKFNEQFKKGG